MFEHLARINPSVRIPNFPSLMKYGLNESIAEGRVYNPLLSAVTSR